MEEQSEVKMKSIKFNKLTFCNFVTMYLSTMRSPRSSWYLEIISLPKSGDFSIGGNYRGGIGGNYFSIGGTLENTTVPEVKNNFWSGKNLEIIIIFIDFQKVFTAQKNNAVNNKNVWHTDIICDNYWHYIGRYMCQSHYSGRRNGCI